MENQKWTATDVSNAKYIGLIEFEDNKGELHNFELMETSNQIIFGSSSNAGFLESGYMEKNDCFSLDENLQELLSDLETFYSDGKEYTEWIICNERM